MKQNNRDRKYELSTKIMRMGQSLRDEGGQRNDLPLSQVGVMLSFIGGLLIDDKNLFEFSKVVGMFSSKRILDDLMENCPEVMEIMKTKTESTSYEDIIKRLEDERDRFNDLDNDELDEDED